MASSKVAPWRLHQLERAIKLTEVSEMAYKIQCDVIRIKGTNKDGEDYDFLTYTAWDKNGKKCKLKFTKSCEGQPKKEGCYVLEIEKEDINRDKQVKFNEYWVKAVKSYTEYDGFKSDPEDLPFD